jgi:hypothetical protein
MTTLLQLVLLLSVIIGIVGGCGMELRYIVVTVILIKLSWMVICWWRTFQQERDNRWLHRRLACGAVIILLISISQLAVTYFVALPQPDDERVPLGQGLRRTPPASDDTSPFSPAPRAQTVSLTESKSPKLVNVDFAAD